MFQLRTISAMYGFRGVPSIAIIKFILTNKLLCGKWTQSDTQQTCAKLHWQELANHRANNVTTASIEIVSQVHLTLVIPNPILECLRVVRKQWLAKPLPASRWLPAMHCSVPPLTAWWLLSCNLFCPFLLFPRRSLLFWNTELIIR